MRATGKTPYKLDPLRLPGVAKATSPKEGSSINAPNKSLGFVLGQKICKWTSVLQVSDQARFRCTNKALTIPEGEMRSDFCGYHQPLCCMKVNHEERLVLFVLIFLLYSNWLL